MRLRMKAIRALCILIEEIYGHKVDAVQLERLIQESPVVRSKRK